MPDLGLLTESKFDERLYMFARRHSNRLSSTLKQRLRISSALMPHFLPPCTSRENWVRTTTSFELAIEIFSIRLISDHFDKLAFSSNKKFTDKVIFFARRHANRLSFEHQQHHQVSSVYTLDLLLSARYVARILGGDERGLFVVDEDCCIVCTRHACGRGYSIFSCNPGFGLHTHLL